MRLALRVSVLGAAALIAAGPATGVAAQKTKMQVEDYVREPMPAGVQVINTELEGPVFADAEGRTLYRWQQKRLLGGVTGDQINKPSHCGDQAYSDDSGFMG